MSKTSAAPADAGPAADPAQGALATDEKQDGLMLALAAVLVPATWLFLGWSWSRSVAGHDGLAHTLLLLQRLASASGDWSSLVYLPDLLGGAEVRNVVGPFPPFSAFARLGFSPTAILNLTVFLLQVLVAFLGARLAEDMASAWQPGAARLGWSGRLAVTWLSAFAPVLAWRLAYGHAVLVVGALPLLAGLALFAAVAARRLTVVLLATVTAVFCLALLYSAQQTLFYAAFFGAPLLLCAWLSLGGGVRPLAAGLVAFVSSLLLALPGTWGMVAHAFSSDAPRLLGHESVTYSFLTSTAADWLSSIPWTRSAVPAARQEMYHHEVNYPLGPLVVILVLLPWRRARALAVGAALSIVLVVAFSMDLRPISAALLALVPPLNYFRVPARAALPLLLTLPAFAVAAALASLPATPREASETKGPASSPQGSRSRRDKKKERARSGESGLTPSAVPTELVALPLGVLVVLLPSVAREIVVWGLAIALVFLLRAARPSPALSRWLSVPVVLLALGAASVSAFHERLPPLQDGGALLAEATAIGSAVRQGKPEAASPLSRVRLDLEMPAFAVNTAFASDLSSLDGYHFPTRRFAQLLFALRGVRYEPTAVFFKLARDEPAFTVLRPLYNVGGEASLSGPGRLEIKPLGPTAGPAWFADGLALDESMDSLARHLLADKDAMPRKLTDAIRVVASDPFVVAAAPPVSVDPACRQAEVRDVRWDGRGASAKVAVGADCPLVFATNFVEALQATLVSDGGRREPAHVFPAFGALAGVWVRKGTTEVQLGPAPMSSPGGPLAVALGLAVLTGGAFWLRRGSSHRDPSKAYSDGGRMLGS
jgi:hypothetical protein